MNKKDLKECLNKDSRDQLLEHERKISSATYKETVDHIEKVKEFMSTIIARLYCVAYDHDKSKLEEPEFSIFEKWSSKLRTSVYGSDEYYEMLNNMKPALDHHYANNSHHPEYYKNGISDMDIVDLIEMICDWKAATLRHDTGDINKSIEINAQRFDIPSVLCKILKNTVDNYF